MPVEKSEPWASRFSPEIRAELDEAFGVEDCLWVTDADKTLWSGDIGEAFLRHLAATKALVAAEAQGDVWATYESKVARDQTRGYAWAAQAMAGLPEAEVRRLASAFAAEFVSREAFPALSALAAEAGRRGCEMWVVSASNQWIVEAAAPLMGFDPSRVIGIRVAVEDGVLTDRVVEPVSNRAGKVAAIEQVLGRRPTLVTGDSSGDFEMLAFAERAVLITQPGLTNPDYVAYAREQGWLVQVFDPPGR